MDKLRFIIPGKPEYLTMIRLAVGSVMSTAGFDVEAVDDLKNAVSEACKNISCHGSQGFSDQYEILCEVEPGNVRITVQDDCDVHTLEKMAVPCRKCPEEGNLGLFVIQSLVDDVRVEADPNGRRSITMVKRAGAGQTI